MSVITVLAVICVVSTSPSDLGTKVEADCNEYRVATSDDDPTITMWGCVFAQPALAQWVGRMYPAGSWLQSWRCVEGKEPAEPERKA